MLSVIVMSFHIKMPSHNGLSTRSQSRGSVNLMAFAHASNQDGRYEQVAGHVLNFCYEYMDTEYKTYCKFTTLKNQAPYTGTLSRHPTGHNLAALKRYNEEMAKSVHSIDIYICLARFSLRNTFQSCGTGEILVYSLPPPFHFKL